MAMTKEEFKERWDSDEDAGGITNAEIADCYVAWGLGESPYSHFYLDYVVRQVTRAAGTAEWQDAKE